MINIGSTSFRSWLGNQGQHGQWDAWKGTNSGFDGSLLSGTNNDVPMPIPDPAAPFSQFAWANPSGREALASSLLWVGGAVLVLTTLAPTSARPFTQNDWQNPIAVRSVAQPSFGSRASLQSVAPRAGLYAQRFGIAQPQNIVATNLLETTLAPSAATPFSQTDWQLYTRAVWERPGDVQNTLPLTAKPFSQADWQNPERAKATLNQGWIQQRPSYYQEPPFFPASIDYQRRIVSRDVVTDPQNLLGSTLAPVSIIRTALTGISFRAKATQQPQAEVNRLALIAVEAEKPFIPVDFQNPVPARRVVQPVVGSVRIIVDSGVAIRGAITGLPPLGLAKQQPHTQPQNLLLTTLSPPSGPIFGRPGKYRFTLLKPPRPKEEAKEVHTKPTPTPHTEIEAFEYEIEASELLLLGSSDGGVQHETLAVEIDDHGLDVPATLATPELDLFNTGRAWPLELFSSGLGVVESQAYGETWMSIGDMSELSPDLWLDREITQEEADAILSRLTKR
jgi:hypothetical protein